VVSETVAAGLYGLGFRRFAVDTRETRPLILASGQAGPRWCGARELSNAVQCRIFTNRERADSAM